MTIFELLTFVIYLAIGIASAYFTGSVLGTTGYLLGFIVGIAVLHGFLHLLVYLEQRSKEP